MTSVELMKNIVKKTSEFTEDIIFLHIFNKLTENDKVKNYSHNSNGIFFDLTKIKPEVLEEIIEELDNYRYTHEEVEKNNLDREKLINGLKSQVSHLDSCIEKGEVIHVLEEECHSEPDSDTFSKFDEMEQVSDNNSLCSDELFGYSSE
jgi:hypothetical protein